jgi:glycosyltransferase involved in cell wall biosynthesis
MKIAILWTFPADFIQANAKFAQAQGHEVLLVLQQSIPYSPVVPKLDVIETIEMPTFAELFSRLDEFGPDVIVFPGWNVPTYTRIAFKFHNRASRIMVTDTQWRATFKQLWGRVVFQIARWRFFDWALVPGERQLLFVKKLGFPIDKISLGSIPANIEIFGAHEPSYRNTRQFLFVGRLVKEKGLHLLLEAYEKYRSQVTNPWKLNVAGEGYIGSNHIEGVTFLGPLSPNEVSSAMRTSSAFVLPSIFEPWAVVIQEAALSGLPIIASDECGATPHYVHNGLNGFRIKTNSMESILKALIAMTELSDESLEKMSSYSISLAKNQTQESWLNACERIAAFDQLSSSRS